MNEIVQMSIEFCLGADILNSYHLSIICLYYVEKFDTDHCWDLKGLEILDHAGKKIQFIFAYDKAI